MMLMDEAMDFFIKIPTKTSSFGDESFHKVENHLMTLQTEFYARSSPVNKAYFQFFMAVKLQVTRGPYRSVKVLFLNNMRLLDYELEGKKKR